MYDIAGQGIPLVMPINQAQAVKAVLTDSKVSGTLYGALGVDVDHLKKTITQEISRGIATSLPYRDIARNLSNAAGIPLNRAKVITRTEGHRIQQTATVDAQQAAKAKGADVVKQWDAALDARTRESHAMVDGEIRELDEPFSNGLMFPGDPEGRPEEVINCRCTSDTRARWALGEAELQILKDRAEYFGIDKTKNFEEFQQKYLVALQSSADIYKSYEQALKSGSAPIHWKKDGKPFEMSFSRQAKKAIIEKGIEEDTPIFAKDTPTNIFASVFKLIPKEEGKYTVGLHGAETFAEFFGEPIDAYTLAQIIRQRKDYQTGTPIKLLSCYTGMTKTTGNCFAQLLANELGVIVEAPNDILETFIDTDGIGKYYIGDNPLNTTLTVFYPR